MDWELQAFGEANLRQVPSPSPAIEPGQLQVRMRASALNYRDLLMIRGQYDPRVPLPLIPCSDGVGVIEETGERVCPTFASGWVDGPPLSAHRQTTRGGPLPGTLTRSLGIEASGLVPIPDYLSDEEAACLPCAWVTAWHALQAIGVGPGSRILTLGTGGVSIAALQLAKAMGAEVAITSSSDDKLARARTLGADFTINYRTTPKWGRAIAGWHAVDGVIEVGGAGTLNQSLRAVRTGGTIALIGVLAGPAEVDLVRVLMASIDVRGIFVGSRVHFTDLLDFLTKHGIRPVIDTVFPYDALPEALQYLAAGRHFGKIVVRHPN